MGALVLAAASAFWLGLITSISPCPMATNIAAISFIGRKVGSPRKVLLAGLLYAVGRTLAYVALAALLVSGLLAESRVSYVLGRYLSKLLGPLLIVVGMVLLELIRPTFTTFAPGERTQRLVEGMGVWGAGLLGIVFALSFCPISAGYFFVSLIPLAARHGSRVLVPSLFGVGTALPVVVFAVLIVLGARAVGGAFKGITQFEQWARRATGVFFVGLGVYFSLAYTLSVL